MIVLISLDDVGSVVGEIVNGWAHLVSGISPDYLPILAYVFFSIIVLALWLFVTRSLPRSLAGISWILLFSILLTPTTSLGTPPNIAQASIAVIYGILTKDSTIIFNGLLPMMVVTTVGCILGFLWQLLRMGVEKNNKKNSPSGTISS